jgi:hypothetical protein
MEKIRTTYERLMIRLIDEYAGLGLSGHQSRHGTGLPLLNREMQLFG